MNPIRYAILFAVVLFLGMLLFLELGRAIGLRRLAKEPETARDGIGVVNGAVFGLLGLIIAFTFSGAAGRFDARRQLIIQEVNQIGTVWKRVDLLSAGDQPALRELLRSYVDSRLKTYQMLPDIAGAEAEYARSLTIQEDIWRHAVMASGEPGVSPAAASLFLTSVNAMFDIAATRRDVTRVHPPTVIFVFLFLLSLGCALLAGYGMAGGKSRSWAHTLGFAFALALSVYVIFEIEYPRLGLIQVGGFDQALVEQRDAMR